MGHIRDLPKSKLGVDIENNFEPVYIESKGKDDVIKAYGNGYTEQGNMLRYVSGKKSLSFIMSGDTVSVISYDLDILG